VTAAAGGPAVHQHAQGVVGVFGRRMDALKRCIDVYCFEPGSTLRCIDHASYGIPRSARVGHFDPPDEMAPDERCSTRVHLTAHPPHPNRTEKDTVMTATLAAAAAPRSTCAHRPRERHALIFARFDALQPGQALQLVNDHDPKPLRYQFEDARSGSTNGLPPRPGPALWRVQISQARGAPWKAAGDSCCSGGPAAADPPVLRSDHALRHHRWPCWDVAHAALILLATGPGAPAMRGRPPQRPCPRLSLPSNSACSKSFQPRTPVSVKRHWQSHLLHHIGGQHGANCRAAHDHDPAVRRPPAWAAVSFIVPLQAASSTPRGT